MVRSGNAGMAAFSAALRFNGATARRRVRPRGRTTAAPSVAHLPAASAQHHACGRNCAPAVRCSGTAKLASQVANRELDTGSVMHLYHETGGYPLFVVEMVRADLGRAPASLLEADHPHGQPPLDDARTLPPRVHAVLVGRLLQLSP